MVMVMIKCWWALRVECAQRIARQAPGRLEKSWVRSQMGPGYEDEDEDVGNVWRSWKCMSRVGRRSLVSVGQSVGGGGGG